MSAAGRLPGDFRRGLGGGTFEQRPAPAPPGRVRPGRDWPRRARGRPRSRCRPCRTRSGSCASGRPPPSLGWRHRDGESVAVSVAELGDELAFVRSLAAWHLGRLGPAFPDIEQALVPLREQLEGDKDPSVRAEAALALGMLEGKGAPPPELKSLSAHG